MKITAVQALPLGIPLAPMTPPSPWAPGVGRQILVRITTDDGLVGWGECFAYGATLAVCNVVDDALAPLLIGQDPTQIELHTDRLHRALMIWGRRGLAMMAVSGVELALWDIAGKARGVPVYQLLGGLCQPSVRAYASLLRYDTHGAPPPGGDDGAEGRLHGGQAPPDRRGLGGCGPRGGRAERRHHARHELPVDGGGRHPHRPQARALRPALAGGAGVAARGLRGPGAGAPGRAHPDRLRRERGHRLRVSRDHRRRRRRHRAAQHDQGGRDRRDEEDRRAGRCRQRDVRAALLLLRPRAGRHASRRGLDAGRPVRRDAARPAERALAGQAHPLRRRRRRTSPKAPVSAPTPIPTCSAATPTRREAARPFYLT